MHGTTLQPTKPHCPGQVLYSFYLCVGSCIHHHCQAQFHQKNPSIAPSPFLIYWFLYIEKKKNQFVVLFIYAWGLFLVFFKIFIYFRERARQGETEEEKHGCERETLIGCLLHASNQRPGLQPRHVPWSKSNWRPFGLQDNTQATESHESGIFMHLLVDSCMYPDGGSSLQVCVYIYHIYHQDDALNNWATWPGLLCSITALSCCRAPLPQSVLPF